MLPSRVGTRFTTLSLLAVILFVLCGLVAADRALAREDMAHAELDAEQSAGLVQGFLSVHAVALMTFQGPFITGEDRSMREDRELFLALVRAMGEHVSGFRRVWIADSAGVVMQDAIFGMPASPLTAGFDLDTLQEFGLRTVMHEVRETGRPSVSRAGTLFSGETGVVIVEPLTSEGRVVGFAGGSIPAGALLGAMGASERATRARVTLRSRDTVIAQVSGIRDRPAPLATAASVRVPGGGMWQLVLEHEAPNSLLRTIMWTLGITVLVVLTSALMHERRQAARIADRSSELERLSGELLAANRAKSEFLANISHELRTPLNAIVGFADLLREGVYGELGPRQVGPVQRIEASATHLRQLVDQILDLAKMAAGRLEVHVETIDLRPFVLEVASEVEPLINERGLSLSIAVGATLPRARTDPAHLRQILVNLLGNAVKYTEQGGVAVRARLVKPGETLPARGGGQLSPPAPPIAPRHAGPWIALQVIDTGVGVAPGDQERIFEEFEQVNAGARGDTARRGTGLGLPISRRLARLLGGDVSLDSERGRGSTFILWIPVE